MELPMIPLHLKTHGNFCSMFCFIFSTHYERRCWDSPYFSIALIRIAWEQYSLTLFLGFTRQRQLMVKTIQIFSHMRLLTLSLSIKT